MTNTIQTAKELTFGTELEYTNISRERAVKAIHSVVGGTIRYTGGGYDEWTVVAPDGRHWKAVSDGSLGSRSTSAEGGDPDPQMGRHGHPSGGGSRAPQSRSENSGMHQPARPHRSPRFQRPADRELRADFLQAGRASPQGGRNASAANRQLHTAHRPRIHRPLEKAKPTTREELNKAWFGYSNPNPAHYDSMRYHAINLNNVWRTGTVEVRAFNGTTHAGEVKSHIVLCLAIAALAKNAKCASTKNQRPFCAESAKYDMRVFLLRLGLIGEEFKNVRMHLLKHLPGNTAWKHGRPEGR